MTFNQLLKACLLLCIIFQSLWVNASDLKTSLNSVRSDLITAAKTGDIQGVQLLLDQGVDLEAVDLEMKATALDIAARIGQAAMVQLLLDKGANIEARNKNGGTPLITAAFWRRSEIVLLLVEHGADVNAVDSTNRSAMYRAITDWGETGYYDDKRYLITQILLNNGADIEIADQWGDTPLMVAVEYGKKDIVALLLDKGADVHARDFIQTTPLHMAVLSGNKDIVSLLIEKGADIHARSKNGTTILHSAAYGGNKDIVDLLLDKGADIHATDENGRKPFSCAAQNGSAATLQLLLDRGAELGRGGQRRQYAFVLCGAARTRRGGDVASGQGLWDRRPQ